MRANAQANPETYSNSLHICLKEGLKWIKLVRFFDQIGDLDWQNQRDKFALDKSS